MRRLYISLYYIYLIFFFLMLPLPPRSTLFPYTTLFRSILFFFVVVVCRWKKSFTKCATLDTHSLKLRLPCASPETTLITKDRKSTRLNSSHVEISYAVFCLKKKKKKNARKQRRSEETL